MTRVTEHMAKMAVADSRVVIADRERATDKRIDYKSRLFWDGCVARAEARMIDRANRIITELKAQP